MLRIMALLAGPIFAKEMVELARRKRYYFNRVLYGLVLLFALFIVYESFSWRLAMGRASIRMMAEIAHSLFMAVANVQYWAVYLLCPLFLAGVICSEREERTLELLFTTRLTDREIVLGKLGSRIAVFSLLILCGLPVMSLVMFFGGIDPNALWRMLAVTLLAILYTSAHAIYFSAVTKGAMGAVVRTYWWMALWLFGVPLLAMIPLATIRSTWAIYQVMTGILFLNPIGPYIVVIVPDAYTAVEKNLGPWFFPFTFVAPTSWSLFLIWRAVRRVRLDPTILGLLVEKSSMFSGVRALRRQWKEWRAARRRAKAERIWYVLRVVNPLWLRSRIARVYDREGVVGRIQFAAWLVAGFFILVLAVFQTRELGRRGCATTFLVPTWIVVAVLVAIVSGSSLVGDRRRGFLDLVLLTPLTPSEIVHGTFFSIWEHLRRIYWLPWAIGIFFCLTGSTYLPGLLASMLTATLFGAVLILHGIACSLTAKTAPGALVPTFALPLLMIVGLMFLLPIFRGAARPALWVLAPLALGGCWFWVRRRTTPAAVGCFFVAVHLMLITLATCWVGSSNRELPILAINPGFLTVIALDASSPSWFLQDAAHSPGIYLCYWGALVVNFIWARWWLVRHFERLVERPRRAAKQTLASAEQFFPAARQPASRSPLVQ
ncbi:MAG TPA: ABC transporter permease subunit [Gemmataceae bacterium]|nr:ABC transporter permease subunit [Gemmataceae bacterium]